MPELPEVQTVINYLNPIVSNQTILDVQVYKDKLIKNVTVNQFIEQVKAQKILNLSRKGKYILFHLANQITMVAHLRMEGKFFIYDNLKLMRNHDYIIFKLSGGQFLVFNDTRQFGTFHIVKTSELNDLKELKKVAQDPLEANFNFDRMAHLILKSNKNIKTILLDQSIVSGLGNIYANEVLFATRINPLTKGKDLTIDQVKAIFQASKKILTKAIKYNGTTIHSFKFGNNQRGSFLDFLKVHFKAKHICSICLNHIIRFKDHGRSIYCCPVCQNLTAEQLAKINLEEVEETKL